MSSLTEFWASLNGPVHPADAPTLELNRGRAIFNLDFPPPAFVGDVDNAPVVVLMANGGYDPVLTPSEFADDDARRSYVEYLRQPGPVDPANISPYYARNAFYAPLINTGQLVIVNACAYRSRNVTPAVVAIADLLPSVATARNWMRSELLPAARRGERLIVAHRWSLWRLPPDSDRVLFSTAPASPHLPIGLRTAIADFLAHCA